MTLKPYASYGDMFRGHLTYKGYDDKWYFWDTHRLVSDTWKNRPCGYCNKYNTKEGYDGCLGCLPDVMNACCGHGHDRAYVQFNNSYVIRGIVAHQFFREIKQ